MGAEYQASLRRYQTRILRDIALPLSGRALLVLPATHAKESARSCSSGSQAAGLVIEKRASICSRAKRGTRMRLPIRIEGTSPRCIA